MDINNIKKILNKEKNLKKEKIHDWKISYIDEEKSSIYLTKNNAIETIIDSEREQVEITIYVKIGNKLGESSFTIFKNEETDKELENNLKKELVEQKKLAKLSLNKIYELPSKKFSKKTRTTKEENVVKRADQIIITAFEKKTIRNKLFSLIKELSSQAKEEKNIKLSSSELIITLKRRKVLNSKGLEQKDISTSVYVEAVLNSINKKTLKEQEYLANKKVVRIKDLKLKEFIKKDSEIARDILRATNATGSITDNILLTGDALREYFSPNLGLNPLVFHCSAKIKNMKLSIFNFNEKVTTPNMTIISNPLIPFNINSNSFDSDGVSSKKVVLIDKGIFKNYFASKQYADYQKVNPTGELGVIEIGKGNNSPKELEKLALVEIIAFSSFSPNSVSGDFSAEIRLAYLHKKNKKIPIRAAMFSGNIFRIQHHLSSKIEEQQGYKGPDKVLVKGAVLSSL